LTTAPGKTPKNPKNKTKNKTKQKEKKGRKVQFFHVAFEKEESKRVKELRGG